MEVRRGGGETGIGDGGKGSVGVGRKGIEGEEKRRGWE